MGCQGLSAAGAACSSETLKWGKKKGRWIGGLQRCMFPGNWETQLACGGGGEEKEAAAGLCCPLVCTEVLMTSGQTRSKGVHCWAVHPGWFGSQIRTFLVIHDFKQENTYP